MFGAPPHVPQPHPLWSGAGRATVTRCVPDRPICLSVRAKNFADRGFGNSLQYRAFWRGFGSAPAATAQNSLNQGIRRHSRPASETAVRCRLRSAALWSPHRFDEGCPR